MIDMSGTIVPKSDQLNADDLIAGPRTVVITDVRNASKSDDTQPIDVYFEGDNGKPYKPCKSMRRVMVKGWGIDGSQYVGKAMTLFLDPAVKFGGNEVGGIRISEMSDISRDFSMVLTVSRANRRPYQIKQIVRSNPAPTIDAVALVTEAGNAASCGLAAYQRWFGEQNTASKKYLVDGGEHQIKKDKAIAFDAADLEADNEESEIVVD